MPDVSIRAAAESDADAIASLAGELGYAATAAEMAPRLATACASSSDAVLVAVVDDKVVGWIHVGYAVSVETAPFAEIRGLVVTESQRGRNIGSMLVTAAETWAREQGLDRIRVRSNIVRERTHRFYEERGYQVKKTQKTFDKTL